MGAESLIVVSGDSHATMPLDAWDDYIEPDYRHLLPECRADNVQYTGITGHIFVAVQKQHPRCVCIKNLDTAFCHFGMV